MKSKMILLSVVTFFFVGCGGSGPKVEKPTENRPDWVDMGSGAFPDEENVAFYGVGLAELMTHPTLSSRRTAADLNARAELARSFTTKIEEMLKAYERIVGDGELANIESFHQQATKAFTDLNLTGAFIVNRYYDPSEKAQYSLARMSLTDFKSQIEQMEELSEEVEQTILNHAEEAFGEISGRSDQ